MQLDSDRRLSTIVLSMAVIGALCAKGCQQYQQRPLDLQAYRAQMLDRLCDSSPTEQFTAALRDQQPPADAPDAFNTEDGISAAEAEVLALLFNPELRIKRLEAGLALATYEHAGLWDDPVFGFDGAEIVSPSGPLEYGLTVGFTIPISGRIEVEKARAGAAHEAALRQVVDAEWSTRAAVRRLWVRWSAAIEKHRQAQNVLEDLRAVIELAGRLQDAGEMSRAESRALSITLAGQETDVMQLKMQAADLHAQLLHLLGLPPDADITLLPGPVISEYEASDKVDQQLIERNTKLAVRQAEYQIAERKLELEIRKQFPDIEIGGGYGNEDDDRLLLGLSIAIPILNANRQGIAEARASRELARALAETTYEQLSSELHRAMMARKHSSATRKTFNEAAISQASAQIEELRRLADLGEINTLLLVESFTAMLDAQIRAIDLSTDERLAAIRISELLGPGTPLEPAPVSVPDTHNAGDES